MTASRNLFICSSLYYYHSLHLLKDPHLQIPVRVTSSLLLQYVTKMDGVGNNEDVGPSMRKFMVGYPVLNALVTILALLISVHLLVSASSTNLRLCCNISLAKVKCTFNMQCWDPSISKLMVNLFQIRSPIKSVCNLGTMASHRVPTKLKREKHANRLDCWKLCTINFEINQTQYEGVYFFLQKTFTEANYRSELCIFEMDDWHRVYWLVDLAK